MSRNLPASSSVTSRGTRTHFLPALRFVLKGEFGPLQEVEFSVCGAGAAVLRGLRWFWSCRLFGSFRLGLRVGPTARFLALYIRLVEVVSHHPTTSPHEHTGRLLYQFLLCSASSSPSLETTSCSVPSEAGHSPTSNHQKNRRSWKRKGDSK